MNKRVVLNVSIICCLGALMLLAVWAPSFQNLFSPKHDFADSAVWSSDGWHEIIPQKNMNRVPQDSVLSPSIATEPDVQKSDSIYALTEKSDLSKVHKEEKADPLALIPHKKLENGVVDSTTEKQDQNAILDQGTLAANSKMSQQPAKNDTVRIHTAHLSSQELPVAERDSLNQLDSPRKRTEHASMIDSLLAEILAAQDSMGHKLGKAHKTTVDSVLLAKRRTVGVELRELIYGKQRNDIDKRDPVSFSGMKSQNVSLTSSQMSTFNKPASKPLVSKSGYSSWQIGLNSGPSQHQSQANGALGGLTSSLFLDYFITPEFSIGTQVGIGRLSLSDSYTGLQTQIVRADIRIKYQMNATETIKPFVSLGLGLDHFDAARVDSQIEPVSFASFVAGTGVNVGVTQHVSLVLSGEFRLINGQISDNSQSNDSSASAKIGFSYRFHKKASSETGKDLLASKSISFP
jgi:hypothetical protein